MPTPKIILKKVKNNGFSLPLHPFQVIAYLVIALDAYAFYFVSIVAFSYSEVICSVLGILYSVTFLFVIYFAAKATSKIPTDPTIKLYKESKEKG